MDKPAYSIADQSQKCNIFIKKITRWGDKYHMEKQTVFEKIFLE